MSVVSIVQADCLDFLRAQPPDSIDLVFGSPPYEEARLYLEGGKNLGISRKTDAWVSWLVEVYKAAQAACKGLVVFVVGHGQTDGFRWSAGPAKLLVALDAAGMNVRNPPLYVRDGIPGSGGKDWLKAVYEWIVCTSRPGRLPWSDSTAMGDKPRYPPGGRMTNRMRNGKRVHERNWKDLGQGGHLNQGFTIPDVANPGNLIDCGPAGGGHIGSRLAHRNEAPFPELLAEFFVLSFCPPGGTCCDPFSGSGTTAAVCKRHGRNFAGCDLRQSQVELGLKRVADETPLLFNGLGKGADHDDEGDAGGA